MVESKGGGKSQKTYVGGRLEEMARWDLISDGGGMMVDEVERLLGFGGTCCAVKWEVGGRARFGVLVVGVFFLFFVRVVLVHRRPRSQLGLGDGKLLGHALGQSQRRQVGRLLELRTYCGSKRPISKYELQIYEVFSLKLCFKKNL